MIIPGQSLFIICMTYVFNVVTLKMSLNSYGVLQSRSGDKQPRAARGKKSDTMREDNISISDFPELTLRAGKQTGCLNACCPPSVALFYLSISLYL